MVAKRRSSARIQSSQVSVSSAGSTPKKTARTNKVTSGRVEVENSESEGLLSDVPRPKRRKTRNSAARTKLVEVDSDGDHEINEASGEENSDAPIISGRKVRGKASSSKMVVKVEVPSPPKAKSTSTSTSTSVGGSEAATPSSFGFGGDGNTDTPATSVSDEDEETDWKPTTRNKGKGKIVIPASDDESELSEPDSANIASDSDILPSRARTKGKAKVNSIGKGKQKEVVPASVSDIDESDFQVSASESEYSEFDNEEDDDAATVASASTASGPASAQVVSAAPALVANPRPIARPRYRMGRNLSRADRARQNLYAMHPELRNVWDEFGKRPLIEVKEDPQPEGLALNLLPFQKEGLHWLRMQEQTEFRGGILADEMGMGKTIQTLALLMSEPRGKPNLVVAPTVAIMQWKSEIEKYTGKALSVSIFHGTLKGTSSAAELANTDVILTTYNQLESVYRKQQHGFKRKNGLVKEKSLLHKVKFHRVILDEAHNIKDRSCNTAKAVFALETTYKLCLSGTPLQNRIGELFSLLRFLEADPFAYYYCRQCSCKHIQWSFKDNRSCDHCGHPPMSHLCFFNYDCLKPIQNNGNEGEGAIAFKNIHKLLKHIMLRRTKKQREEDLGLPPKTVKIRRDRFTEEELDLYASVYSDSKRKFDTYVAQGVVLNNYANIFTLITRMRQMADHPDLVLRKHAEEGQNTLVCVMCDDEAEDAIKSRCHHTFCRDCVTKYMDSFDGSGKLECPKCHVELSIDLSQPAIEVDELVHKRGSIINRIDMSKWRSSTKIEALCEELYKLRSPSQTTKSIVFSQFTSMLQLIEWRLHRAGFKTVMLEGSMSPAQREATIKHFMENVEVEVFLVSLKAGGVALNLIEANQVFIMDPWWNPSQEWQAADRIHRIGQTRPCRITRLVIQDSIESKIVELQEKKERMINATVNADEKAMERLSPADMQFLFTN